MVKLYERKKVTTIGNFWGRTLTFLGSTRFQHVEEENDIGLRQLSFDHHTQQGHIYRPI